MPFPRALLLAASALCACGGTTQTPVAEPRAEARRPSLATIADPRPPVTSIVTAEVLSSELTDWLAMRLQIRDLGAVSAALSEGFQGSAPFGVGEQASVALPLGATRSELMVSDEPLAAAAWRAALDDTLAAWRRVEDAHFALTAAEFAPPTDASTWGAADVTLHLVGEDADGGREAFDLAMRLRVVLADGAWSLDRMLLVAGDVTRQARPLFVEVTRPVGVHQRGARFGQPGNDSDGWNGLACADVDGDGRLDVFAPGPSGSFLYRGLPSGRFEDCAAESGLGQEQAGTGAVFFDVDNDGDQDLAVAHIGWRALDDAPHGQPVRLYHNDGRGHFREADLGVELYLPAYSLVAFDADGDGFTDLFVCGYGRMEHEPNDSWIEALNGAEDRLLRNVGGAHFEDVTRAAGLRDRSWTYAAAAADYDRDGDLDLYTANTFGSNRLWTNQGDGTFEDRALDLGVAARGITFGCSWGDLDGDGVLDLYLARPSSTTGNRLLARIGKARTDVHLKGIEEMASGNQLFLGGAGGRFTPRALGPDGNAGWAWTPVLADLDLDGRLDVYCTNGFVTGDLPQDT